MIQEERVRYLNDKPTRRGRYVLYWMQASQRATCNHALEWAIRQANDRKLPVVVAFGLMDHYPQAGCRHYAFMLEGLRETAEALRKRGILLVVRRGMPGQVALELAEQAGLVVMDRGYTRHQVAWRQEVSRAAPCGVAQVESDVVVPVEAASDKQEYAAATIRPKLHRQWGRYLVPLEATKVLRDSLGMDVARMSPADVDSLLADLAVDQEVGRVRAFVGGTRSARRLLEKFLREKLPRYASERNDPGLDIQSHQSPYLHFGQISPLEIALRVAGDKQAPQVAKDAYLEELLVRRELAINYVHYCPNYDSYRALPAWSQATLRKHRLDRRPVLYTLRQMERAETDDEYWNAAMREMLVTGKMHNYMRMYWGKKIIAWSRTPEQAFRHMLYLDNKYFLDGRDPCSWMNVAWCFGLHDRPWKERSVFGTVRYMNAAGLERKFDMDAYVTRVNRLKSPA